MAGWRSILSLTFVIIYTTSIIIVAGCTPKIFLGRKTGLENNHRNYTNMPPEKVTLRKKVKVERVFPEALQSHFVTNMVIQHEPDIFILSFFQTWPPAIVGETDEEKRGAFDSIESIKATCVARLVVTPDKMREFLAVMTENLEKYEQLMKMLSTEKE